MERTAKIETRPRSIIGKNCKWKATYRVTLYMDNKFLVDYTRGDREQARKIAREYKKTGMCPTH